MKHGAIRDLLLENLSATSVCQVHRIHSAAFHLVVVVGFPEAHLAFHLPAAFEFGARGRNRCAGSQQPERKKHQYR